MSLMNADSNVPPDVPHLSADDLYWEEVEAARHQSVEQKLLAGPDLFELACEFMRSGIRSQFPDADAAQVQAILEQRLALGRRLENIPT
jgi:hypothetical protein